MGIRFPDGYGSHLVIIEMIGWPNAHRRIGGHATSYSMVEVIVRTDRPADMNRVKARG